MLSELKWLLIYFLVNFNSFSEDLEKLSSRIGIHLRSDVHVNSSVSYSRFPVISLDSILSEKSKEIIMRYYSGDFALFKTL